MQRTTWQPQWPERDVVMKPSNGVSLVGMVLAAALTVGCGGGSASTSPPPPPLISVTLTPATAQKVDQGQSVSFTVTVANDSSSRGVKWSLSGTGCTGAACGALSNQTATTATYIAPSPVAANVSVSVTATSAADSTKSASDSVTVFPPPTVTTTSLQNATGGSAYNVTLQESGGIAPFTWSLASGSSLPAGLSLDSNGSISGTPTAGGLFNFTVQVADSANPPVATTAKLSLTIVILPPSPVPATVSGTIDVGTAPSGIAVDSTTNRIYVADFGTPPPQTQFLTCPPAGGDVTVIDGAIDSSSAVPIQPGAGVVIDPVAIALNETTHTAYVVAQGWWINVASQQGCFQIFYAVLAIDTSTLVPQRFILSLYSEGIYLSGIAINRLTGSIYVGYFAGATKNIIVITGNGYGTIPVSPGPIAINETTNKIYVASSNGIAVIDGATNSVASTIPAPSATVPTAIAVNPTTDTIYVTNSQSNNLTVIDGATGSLMATIPVGISPSGVAVDSQTNFIYVANAGDSQTGNPGNVTVINGATNATTTLSDPKAINPVAVAANTTTNKIYVANRGSNNVTVIDGAHD